MAAKLHPNDHRRIRRSLEVRPASGGALDVCARPAHTDAGSAWARRDDQIYDRMGVCQTQLLRDQVAADPGPRCVTRKALGPPRRRPSLTVSASYLDRVRGVGREVGTARC